MDLRVADNKKDAGVLAAIASHPRVRLGISDDFTREFIALPGWTYLLFDDAGFVAVQPLNYICYQLHIALLPTLWGKGKSIGYQAGLWIFKNTPCQKLVAIIPECNKGAIRIVERCGMNREGVLTKSFSRGFKLHDQIIYGITKGEALCQQQ